MTKSNWLAPPQPRRKSKAPVAPEVPEAPSWLSTDAKSLWAEHAPTWAELGALGRLDVHAAAMLCEEMAAFQRHRDAVLTEGALVQFPHFTGPNPNAKLRDDAAKRIVLLLRQCGLTRASRAGTAMQETPAQATPQSLWGANGKYLGEIEGDFAT